MKWRFFSSDDNRKEYKISERMVIYILSFLDSKSLLKVSLVSNEWNNFVHLAQRYMTLLPIIQAIPMFSQVTLDVLGLKLMAGGMTNATYRITVGSSAYKILSTIPGLSSELIERYKLKKMVLRFPGDVSLFEVNRRHEQYNAQQASDLKLNVPIVYFNGDSGLQVTEFIEGVKSFDKNMLERAEILNVLAEKAKTLHQSESFLNDTDVFTRNESLFVTLQKKEFIFPQEANFIAMKMNELQYLFSSYQINKVPCHNDSTPLNYLLSHTDKDEVIYQIDWEYSSNNDFLWDLAYFAIEAKLGKEQELIYLEAYFGDAKVTDSVWAWYNAYKPVIEWWITLWSWTQLAFEAKAVDLSEYVALGQERYEKTLEHLKSSEFMENVERITSEQSLDELFTHRMF